MQELMTVKNLTPIFNMARSYLDQNPDDEFARNYYNTMICALLDKPLSEIPDVE